MHIIQGQDYRSNVHLPDLWAHCLHTASHSPTKIEACDKCASCSIFSRGFLLNNEKECTLQWRFYRLEGEWPHMERHGKTREAGRPWVQVKVLPLGGCVWLPLSQPLPPTELHGNARAKASWTDWHWVAVRPLSRARETLGSLEADAITLCRPARRGTSSKPQGLQSASRGFRRRARRGGTPRLLKGKDNVETRQRRTRPTMKEK